MIKTLCEAIVDWVDGLALESGISASFAWVPVVERKDITETVIIVSPASNAPTRRNRSKIDGVIDVDIAIGKPTEGNANTACEAVVGYAQDVIEAAFNLVLSTGTVIEIEQPIIIDQEYFRQSNLAITVVRLRVRTY